MKLYGYYLAVNQNNVNGNGLDTIRACYHKSEQYRQEDVKEIREDIHNPFAEIYFLPVKGWEEAKDMNRGQFVDFVRKNGKSY